METKDEFQTQVTGSLIALRLVLAALVKTHPEPELLLQEIESLLRTQSQLNGHLPDPIEAVFIEQVDEFTSHLHARINCLSC